MTIEEIMNEKERLDTQMRVAASTMERSNELRQLHLAMQQNQNICPHFSEKYNFTVINNKCPYCGKLME